MGEERLRSWAVGATQGHRLPCVKPRNLVARLGRPLSVPLFHKRQKLIVGKRVDRHAQRTKNPLDLARLPHTAIETANCTQCDQ